MTNSKVLSNYDRKTIKKLRESKLLIVDLDGTLIDFEKIDNIIIQTLFPDNRIINTIDNILWKINRLDVFGNGYAGLKIRLAVYSFFSKHTLKYCKERYKQMYKKLARIELVNKYTTSLRKFIESGYDIAIVTKNVYAQDILNHSSFKFISKQSDKLKLIVLKTDKKKQFKSMVKQYDGKVCVIGNNLSDDIFNSYKIGSPYIYIGKSKVVNFIISLTNKLFNKSGIQFSSFDNVRNIFTQ